MVGADGRTGGDPRRDLAFPKTQRGQTCHRCATPVTEKQLRDRISGEKHPQS